MNRPEPKRGDVLIDHGRRTTIDGFDDDRGTRLYTGQWVCISEFVKNADGVWVRESETIPGAPELEMPVGESGPDDLKRAAALARQRGDSEGELLAHAFEKLAWMGGLNVDMLNRTGGPEMVRLARHIVRRAEEGSL